MGDMKGILTAGAALGGSALLPALAPGLAASLGPAALGALGGALGAGAATAGQGGDLGSSLLNAVPGAIGGGLAQGAIGALAPAAASQAVSSIATGGSTVTDPEVDPSFLSLITKDFKDDPVSKGVQLANLGISSLQLANQPEQQRIPLQVGLPQVVSRQPRAQRQPLQRREPRRFFSS